MKLAWLGYFGVVLFFALSGYLMSDLLFIKRVNLTVFFARRFTRVLPTFWLFVLAMMIYAYNIQPDRYEVSSNEAISTLLFTRTYFPTANIWPRDWPVGHLWSLNVEEHSYIYLGIGALIVRRFNARITLAFLLTSVAIILALVYWYATHPLPDSSPRWFFRSECASLGIVAAAACRIALRDPAAARMRNVPSWTPLLLIAVAATCFALYQHKNVQFWVAPLCLAAAVNLLDRVPQMMRSFLSLPGLRWLGRCSFSLYLWQQPFYVASGQHGANPLVACALAVLCGLASFYLFEDPVRRYLNSAWAKRANSTAWSAAR